MLRRVLIAVSFLALAFVAGAPTKAWAHGGHAHSEVAASADAVVDVQSEARTASQSLQSHSPSDDQPINDCHCPACHGCCHAPALSDAPAQFAPFALHSHASPRDDGWFVRRARSAIENPPKTFA